MEDARENRWIGASAPRLEDDALLRGKGRFIDDIAFPGLLEAAFLRSPVAHGRIRRIDISCAKNVEGVVAALRYADLRPLLTSDRIPLAMPAGGMTRCVTSASPSCSWWRRRAPSPRTRSR
jgi:carbon-monoxide dehydrogenase large subunit